MAINLFTKTPRFQFMEKRWIGFIVSGALTVLALGLVFTKGLNLGIDFTGGILMEVHAEEMVELAPLRQRLSGAEFGEVSLQHMGSDSDILIRIQVAETDDQAVVVASVKNILAETIPGTLDYRKIDYVGPTVGEELISAGIMATLLSMAAIVLYLWFRFEWQYGVGGVLALIHDSIMIIGFFAITGFDFGLTAVAAVLTIIGYSINDSVVIYDRIRENMRRFKKMDMEELINISLNETLSRTIFTALTTLLAALALALFGGEVIKGFAWAIVVGVVIGCYSSVYVSAPVLIYLKLREPAAEAQAA